MTSNGEEPAPPHLKSISKTASDRLGVCGPRRERERPHTTPRCSSHNTDAFISNTIRIIIIHPFASFLSSIHRIIIIVQLDSFFR